MFMSVAPVVDQRSVDDSPRLMADGSAVKLLMTGRAVGVVVGVAVVTGGGGGGGGGFFPPQSTTKIANVSARAPAPIFIFCGPSLLIVTKRLSSVTRTLGHRSNALLYLFLLSRKY
jgi:hypothetical protein